MKTYLALSLLATTTLFSRSGFAQTAEIKAEWEEKQAFVAERIHPGLYTGRTGSGFACEIRVEWTTPPKDSELVVTMIRGEVLHHEGERGKPMRTETLSVPIAAGSQWREGELSEKFEFHRVIRKTLDAKPVEGGVIIDTHEQFRQGGGIRTRFKVYAKRERILFWSHSALAIDMNWDGGFRHGLDYSDYSYRCRDLHLVEALAGAKL